MGRMKGNAVGLRISIAGLLDMLEIADDIDIAMNADVLVELEKALKVWKNLGIC